jgi:hypothetical protein
MNSLASAFNNLINHNNGSKRFPQVQKWSKINLWIEFMGKLHDISLGYFKSVIFLVISVSPALRLYRYTPLGTFMESR